MSAWPRSACATFLVFLAAAVSLQWFAGAYGADFAGDPDEPAHYVTGLMVRDYIAAGMPGPPLRYAQAYYSHYPKVGLGHWPPVFYAVEAAWMLAFSASRASVLVLLATISAFAALLLYREAARRYSAGASVAAGLVFISLPLVVLYSRIVMSDMLVCMLVLLAVARFGRYLDSGGWQDNAWFGIWASLAILGKGTGFALALVPLFGLLTGRRWSLAKRWPFWLPLGIVALACGPWYALAPRAQHEDVIRYGGLAFRPLSLFHFAWHWCLAAGIVVAPLAAIGVADHLARCWKGRILDGQSVAFAAFLMALAVFRSMVAEAGNLRAMTMALPFLVFFALAGLDWCLTRLRAPRLVKEIGWPALALLAVTLNLRAIPQAPHFGLSQAAQALFDSTPASASVFLVSSDSTGEGSLIAEIAIRDRRHGHTVLRASKALYSDNWNGGDYRPFYRSSAEVADFLDREGVKAVLVDRSTRMDAEDRRLLIEALETGGGYQRLPGSGLHLGRNLSIYIARPKPR